MTMQAQRTPLVFPCYTSPMSTPHNDYSRDHGTYAIIANWHGGYRGYYAIIVARERDSNGHVLVRRSQRTVAVRPSVAEAQAVLDRWQEMTSSIDRANK
jgi:hypothetical protein